MLSHRLTAQEIETALSALGEFVSMYGYHDNHDEFSAAQHKIAAKVARLWKEGQ